MDTGPILSTRRTPILAEDDSQILHDRLAQLGAELLVETIPDYVAGKILPQPQTSEGSTYAAKIKKEDGKIDWSQPALQIWNRLRAFTPWPGAFTFLQAEPKPQLLKIWKTEVVEKSGAVGTILSADKTGIIVGCGREALRILELQREGGRRLSAGEFLAGFPLKAGQRFRDKKTAMKIKFLTTGGTIDKVYFDAKSEFEVGPPQVSELLRDANVTFDHEVESILRKDSLDMTDADRALIRERVMADSASYIVITHGTDTMILTALALKGIPGKTIVLTGSMQPARLRVTDAGFNLGTAVTVVQTLPPGVYIAMNGRIFNPETSRKNLAGHCFEEI